MGISKTQLASCVVFGCVPGIFAIRLFSEYLTLPAMLAAIVATSRILASSSKAKGVEGEKALCRASSRVHRNSGQQQGGDVKMCNAYPAMPSKELFSSRQPQPMHFDMGHCYGQYILIHKPVDNPVEMATGRYPFAEHLHERKRLWEIRVQMTFRERPEGPMWFGMEQDKYYWPGWMQLQLSLLFLKAVRSVAGAVYQSIGDDPLTTKGEAERPIVAFPFEIVDQYIVTPAGERPPDLCDPAFSKLGQTKTTNRKAFRESINALELQEGQTLTTAFWCVSRFLNAITAQCVGVAGLPDTDVSLMGVHPPCYILFYSLRQPAGDAADRRHLDSRKRHYCRFAWWSSLVPPTEEKQRELLCRGQGQKEEQEAVKQPEWLSQREACCCCQ